MTRNILSSDVNPLFDEVLEDIECKDSYDSNFDESIFLVTPLFDSNEDECLAPRDDIELLLHHDPSISVASILEGFTDEPPLEENDDLFDLESKENDWKKILYGAPIDDLITEDKVFDPGIYEKSFSPTFMKLTVEDHHYLCPVFDLLLPFSSKNEDKVFNPGILISSLLSHQGEIISNFSKSPMMISGGDIPHLDVPFLHFYPP
ncbi:hypothetical protein Tco_0725949 [Tanacetum coccineum]|uniref:Reverse transcriptase domain-containing protein n=1 Tax=Tanacetum coccineum TaxID=301880 RepID=A0ABQ4YGI7_9ASTR